MLQAPRSILQNVEVNPLPIECNHVLKNAHTCFTRAVAPVQTQKTSLIERAKPLSPKIELSPQLMDALNVYAKIAQKGNDPFQAKFESIELLKKLENNPATVQQKYQGMHEALAPVVAEGSPEVRSVYQEITEKMGEMHHLSGAASDDLSVDIFVLFLKLLALLNRQQEQERISRQFERDLQTKYMMNVASNFETQGRWLLNTCIGSGVLSIISGICPILQHSQAGTRLHSIIPDFMKSNTEPKDFFKAIGKMTYAGSEISKSSGQVHSSYSEGWRTRDHHKGEHAKMRGEDDTRTLEDERQYYTNIINSVIQRMQADKDLSQQLAR